MCQHANCASIWGCIIESSKVCCWLPLRSGPWVCLMQGFVELINFPYHLEVRKLLQMLLSDGGWCFFCSHAITTVKMTLCSQIDVKSAEFGRWFVTGPVLVPVFFWLGMVIKISSCLDFMHEIWSCPFQHLFCRWTFLGISLFCCLTYPYTHFNDAFFTCMYVYTHTSLCTPFIYVHMYIKQDNINKNMTHDTLIFAEVFVRSLCMYTSSSLKPSQATIFRKEASEVNLSLAEFLEVHWKLAGLFGVLAQH